MINDVASVASVSKEDVFFQEIDISTADPTQTIFVDLLIDGKDTEGAPHNSNLLSSGSSRVAFFRLFFRSVVLLHL